MNLTPSPLFADSPSLLACSLVCVDWQRLLLGCIYTTAKFRRRVRSALFGGLGTPSKLVFTLEVNCLGSGKSCILN